MNTPIIQVRIKKVYGVDQVYPVCNNATIFASMLGTKTLTLDAIKHIKSLGYIVQNVTEHQATL